MKVHNVLCAHDEVRTKAKPPIFLDESHMPERLCTGATGCE